MEKDGKKILLLGMDSEYTYIGNNTNLCLSYQFYIENISTGENFSHIYYTNQEIEERLSLKDIFVIIFKIAKIPAEDINGYYVNIICHFATAEWSMLSDRAEIAPYFEFLYKTLITFSTKHVSFRLNDIEHNVLFDLSDTMLLLPPSHRSLDKATTLLDEAYNKKSLTDSEKAHMDVLLREDKERFEEYALHDAKITLKLYVKQQELLNSICETDNVRYTTIGIASVTAYQSYCQSHFDKGFLATQFKDGSSDVNKRGYDLARRAYLGGLNNSYFIGECTGALFLDIDFSSAYPTVMNLLRSMEFPKPNKTPSNNSTFTGLNHAS